MLKVGIAGIGFMGWIHWLAYQKIEDVKVVAICDSNQDRLNGDWSDIQGNFGPPGTQVDLTDIKCFTDLNEFCSHDFDLVDICLPPALHLPAIQTAAANDKHVFCEKPLCLNLADCDAAVSACNQASRILQVGHVLPFFPEFAEARRIIDSGEFGRLKVANFKRVIADPVWLKSFYDPNVIGGPLLDLHVHDAHFIRLIAGKPNSVYSRGTLNGEVVNYCHSIFDFPESEVVVASSSGVIEQQGRPFMHGFEIQLEKATLHFEYASLQSGDELLPLKLFTEDGNVSLIEVNSGAPEDAFVSEISEMVASLNQGNASAALDGLLAHDAIQICQAESESVKTGRRTRIG